MSSPLAIGAVTAVLRNLLDNGIVDAAPPIGAVEVTAQAPDRIDLDNQAAPPSLNLFMYSVSPNSGWANELLPMRDSAGNRLRNTPLALDLNYLVTAYGNNDFEAEILLGYAMHLLHERPVLDRAAVRAALDPSPLGASILPPAFQALTASDLADQVETVSITHQPMDIEEMTRLWSATQASYRPSAAYRASVVLIAATDPTANGLPVLSRGDVDLVTGRDRGVIVTPGLVPPYPTIERIAIPDGFPSAILGDTVRVVGHHLDGTGVEVSFSHRLLTTPNAVVVGANTDATGVDVLLPSNAAAEADWPAGLYQVTVELIRPDELEPRTSNIGALLLGPTATLPPTTITRDAVTRQVSVTLSLSPEVRPEQAVTLSLGAATSLSAPHPAQTDSVDFEFGDVPAGAQWVRLSVEGVESRLVDHAEAPPVFDPTQAVGVPA